MFQDVAKVSSSLGTCFNALTTDFHFNFRSQDRKAAKISEPPKKKQRSMTGIVEHRELSDTLSLKSPEAVLPVHRDEVDNNSIQNANSVDYHFENARLESFKNWPAPYIEPAKLAAAGFYFTGEDDKVRCFECEVEVCRWVEGDDPMVDHQRWSGRCRFIRRLPCGNVPIGVDPSTVPAAQPRSFDVCGLYSVDSQEDLASAASSQHSGSTENLPSTAKLGSLGIGRSKGPKHPEFASYDARLQTFESWPKSMPQTKEQLTDAGFYYQGKGDQTVCYYCGGGLKHWEPDDDPWEQHAKWFSKCCYLLMVKGQEYINNVTGQHVAPPSKEETLKMNLPSYIKKQIETPATQEKSQSEEAEDESKPGPSSGNSSVVGSYDSGFSSSTEGLDELKTSDSKNVDDARVCKICYNDELGAVFLPCGHMVACAKCAPGMTSCAVCRGPVRMYVRAFFS